MIIVEIGAYPQEGVGKPDYSRIVTAARERRGLYLEFNQTLKMYALAFTAVNTGTHTAALNATIMTDAAANWTVNALVLLTIVNITDGSSGIIIANTVNTVTVVALTGGTTNQWNPGDIYNIPSPFSWVFSPLAPGGIAHFVDQSTGLATPFTVPQGYILFLISGSGSGTEDVKTWGYLDGYLALSFGFFTSGAFEYENKVVGLSTEIIDPDASDPHTIDATVENIGTGNFEGQCELVGILEAVGTPPLPTTKTIRCKFCGHEETVPQETVRWICPECGKLNMYYDLSKFKGTR